MKESSPDVGSSQKSSDGLVRISQARDSRFISPPEIPFVLPGMPIFVFSHLLRPSS